MENKVKEKKIKFTNADWFSLGGIVVFAVLTWIGFSFKFSWGVSAVCAFLFAILAWGLLTLLKFMKKAEENISKWRIAEIIGVVLTFVVFLLFVDRPMIRTLSVAIFNKSSLQVDARNDVDSLRSLFTKYEMRQDDAILHTQTILTKYRQYYKLDTMLISLFPNRSFKRIYDFYVLYKLDSKDFTQNDIKQYIRERYMDYLSKESARGDMEASGIDGDYKTFKDEMEIRINEISKAAEDFNFFYIPMLGMQNGYYSISQTGNEIVSFLEKKRTKKNPDGYYFLFDIDGSVFPAEPYVFNSEFKPSFDRMARINIRDYFRLWLPVLLSIIINLLMFFSYFVSFRSTKVEISKRSKSKSKPLGGVIIG